MLNLLPPMQAHQETLSDGSLIYHFRYYPKVITSFADALNPSLWHNDFQPFACVIVNTQSNEILLVRDHLGIAPLYYCHHKGKILVVGETIPDILKQLPSTPAFLESQVTMLFSNHKYYSDETLYQGIFRVEPGHFMHFKTNASVEKKAFWQLERSGDVLKYSNDQDYLDHFSLLMTESIKNATKDHTNIAAEFSAGLDSSSVYCAAENINIRPKLYMHTASPGTKPAQMYNEYYEKAFIDHYNLTDIQRIGEEDFDPLQVFNEYAALFAGPAPYLFFMFAHNIFRAVSAGKHSILLSGFGGDQGVSGPIPFNFFLPELIRQKGFREACRSISGGCSKSRSTLRQFKQALFTAQYLHPYLYELGVSMKNIKTILKNTHRAPADKELLIKHSYNRTLYSSLREAEWFFLQGAGSQEVRMRIEYSSLVSKTMGFEYRYPLLYPKLLEFFLSLPVEQKRRNGQGRYLLRRYLSQFVPGAPFSQYKKNEGLGIVPSTFELYKQRFEAGDYQQVFKGLPYSQYLEDKFQSMELRNYIKGYMFKVRPMYP